MKRTLCSLAAFVLSLVLPWSFCVSAAQKGDINGDGVVDRKDAVAVFDYTAKKGTSLTAAQKELADIDDDGAVTVGDATQILRFSVGKEAKLPANQVARLNILSPPYKLKYKMGEAIDMEGFMLSVTYTNGQTRRVNRYSYTGFSDSAGTRIITVACKGRLTSFTVAVEAPPLSHIQLESLPSKRSYKVGEPLSLTGLSLGGVYTDGSTEKLQGFSVSGYNGESGVHTIKLMYMGKTAEFTVGCGTEAKVNCGGTRLNVRSGPNTSYGRVDTFAEGTSIIVTDTVGKNGWIQCWGLGESGTYVYGWCLAEYIKIN